MVDHMSRAEYVDTLTQEALDVPAPGKPAGPDPAHGADHPSSAQQEEGLALLSAWKPRTLADAYRPRPPLTYAAAGIIAQGTLNVVFGAPGSLKSMLLADLAVCIAAGQPWLSSPERPGSGIATAQSPVLWIDLDNGTRPSDERFGALGQAHNVPADAPLHYVSNPYPWLDASNDILMMEVIQVIQHLEAKVMVIDNLGRISGAVKENDGEMARVMGNLRRLSEETGTAVVVIHHQRKQNGTMARKGETLRGHSSIEASLDLALHIGRKEGTDEIAVTPAKMRGPRVAPFGALFTYEHRPGTKELARARFFGREMVNAADDESIDQLLFETLKQHGELNKGTLRDAVKHELPSIGINRISARIDVLLSDERLTKRAGSKNEVLLGLA